MEILDAPQSKISRHFKYLCDAGLVRDERRDQWVHYQLNGDLAPLARLVKAEYGGFGWAAAICK